MKMSNFQRLEIKNMKLKLHKLNNRTQGHYLDPFLIVNFARLLNTTVTINVLTFNMSSDGSLFG